ncbi:MAG: hypothetical protein AB7F96_17655 [Beijerinckiaceae bacterium]
MRRRKVTLIGVSDEYNSKPGLGLEGSTAYDGFMACRDGSTIAHDLVEHVNGHKAIGPIADELQALGAVWFVRVLISAEI